MGRKKTLKLPSLFKTKELAPPRKHHHHIPWHFLLCAQQNYKTLSFRAGDDNITTKTVINSVFFDPFESKIESFRTESDHSYYEGESLETLVNGVRRSERLFFEPLNTSSILENNKAKLDIGGVQNGLKGLIHCWVPSPRGVSFNFKESVLLLAVDSEDPYGDFKNSMEEVVETLGLKDWKGLEELLGWYLRLNVKNNHGFIVLAFVDLLISLAAEATSSDSCSHSFITSYCSALSSFASSPLCLLDQSEVIVDQDEDVGRS